LAYHMFKRVTELAPHRDQAWNNLGMALNGQLRFRDARVEFMKAVNLDPKMPHYPANVALTWLEEQDYRKAIEWAKKSIALDPDFSGAKQTVGFASLALGEWEEGWKGYAHALGGRFRKHCRVGEEPLWDGKRVKQLYVFGEQGIGDEIQMSSCIAEASRDVDKLILECDSRLAGLFKRSFGPLGVEVHGTRRAKSKPAWHKDVKIDAGCGIGGLPEFYRPTPASCPGTPYLTPDPERVLQWQTLFKSWGPKPTIGICWSGGRKWTNSTHRAVGLEALRPLIESIDANWVSLQYKDPTEEIAATGLPIRHFARATQNDDFDEAAALIASLDGVVGIHTALIHLAGAMGVPATALIPHKRIWIWAPLPGLENRMPWYKSVETFHQRKGEAWPATIKRLVNDDQRMGWLRSARGSGVSHVLPVGDRHDDSAGTVPPANPALAAALQAAYGKHERVHHQ